MITILSFLRPVPSKTGISGLTLILFASCQTMHAVYRMVGDVKPKVREI